MAHLDRPPKPSGTLSNTALSDKCLIWKLPISGGRTCKITGSLFFTVTLPTVKIYVSAMIPNAASLTEGDCGQTVLFGSDVIDVASHF